VTDREQCYGCSAALIMNSWVSESAACAAIALYLALELGRIVGDEVSRPLATLEGLVSLPAVVAAVWALALAIGWWTVFPLGITLLLAGRENLRSWTAGQQIASLEVIAVAGLAWVFRFL
jgi:hypothetical protein